MYRTVVSRANFLRSLVRIKANFLLLAKKNYFFHCDALTYIRLFPIIYDIPLESQGIERIDWRIACLTDKISSKFIKIINYESIEKIDHSGTTETGTCSALEIQCCGSFGVRVIVVSW